MCLLYLSFQWLTVSIRAKLAHATAMILKYKGIQYFSSVSSPSWISDFGLERPSILMWCFSGIVPESCNELLPQQEGASGSYWRKSVQCLHNSLVGYFPLLLQWSLFPLPSSVAMLLVATDLTLHPNVLNLQSLIIRSFDNHYQGIFS